MILLETLLHLYGNRVLSFDVACARTAGELSDLARSRDLGPGFADIVIAATARRRQLTILTRDVRHFAPLGIFDDKSVPGVAGITMGWLPCFAAGRIVVMDQAFKIKLG